MWYLILGVAVIIFTACVIIKFYFKQKEDFYEQLQRKIEEQDKRDSSQ
jgi:hypothetical protein